jgi:hypothetical protein
MSSTSRFNFPLLSVGQAQKEMAHNEALQTLDIVACAAVEDGPINDPPALPRAGIAYLVGANPTGDWGGHASCLAAFTGGGWRFVPPTAGLTALVRPSGVSAVCDGASWELGKVRGNGFFVDGDQVVSARTGAIGAPTGGTMVDKQARTAVNAILAALRQHGLIEK